ncbi:MAG: ferrochelatase [Lentisphaerae bacterium]|nr:ferrochelatase [Lentisphaerota bacterium]
MVAVMTRPAILLMAYGTVSSLDDMPAYLLDIREGRPPSPDLVREMRRRYEAIGGSPLLRLAEAQARALEAELARRGRAAPVYLGMRHWSPRIRDAVAAMKAAGVTEAVAVVLAPHYSSLSIGRYRKRLDEALAETDASIRFRVVETWWDQPRLFEAFEGRIRAALARWDGAPPARTRVLFSAHSLPARIKAMGDPYEDQLLAHAKALADRLGLADWMFVFQSAGASPEPWLGPAIEDEIPRLAAEGYRRLLVVPTGFVCDHVEILYDLDLEAKALAADHGIELARTESMNTFPPFIAALADAVGAA